MTAGESGERGSPDVALQGAGRFPDVDREALEEWLARLVAAVAPGRDSLGVRLVGDRLMREANRRYRGLDRTTDVLSFPGGATAEGRHLGDVLISIPTARRQAIEAAEPLGRELRRLLLHGVLHCLGHDHETDGGEMERLERRLGRRWLEEPDR